MEEYAVAINNILDRLDQHEEDEMRRIRLPRHVPRGRNNPFEYLTDSEFIQRFRLSKDCVQDLLHKIIPHLPAGRNRRGLPVPHYLQLLAALRYMATGNFQLTMEDCMEMSDSAVSRFVKRISTALVHIRQEYIKFPTTPNELQNHVKEFYRIAQVAGVIGCVDGTHIKIQSPGGDQVEFYRCRKGYYSLNVQGICDANLKFTNIVANWPGLIHDARIFENSRIYARLEADNNRGRHLLGDSGYGARPFILTPVQNPQTQAEQRYNTAHAKTRNTIERAFGLLKRRFAILSNPLRVNLTTSERIIMACAVLHNIAISNNIPVLDEHGMEEEVEMIEVQNNIQAGEGEHHDIAGEQYRDHFIQRWFSRR